MKCLGQYPKQLLTTLCFLAALVALPQMVLAKDVRLETTYTLAPNGDIAVIMKVTTSMDIYQKMRNNVSNLYLLLRNLSSQRAEMEVENKKADWDDSSRTLTFSYNALGIARNLGNHWEIDVSPQAEFSNLDEDKKTVYFTEEVASPLGNINGKGKLILPEEAQKYNWDASKRVVSYVMPKPKSSSGRFIGLLIAAGVLMVLGMSAMVASFVVKAIPGIPPPPPPGLYLENK
jgi:hypothetical protein